MPHHRLRPWARRLAWAGIVLLALAVLPLGLLQVPAIGNWAAERLVTLVPLSPGYTLDIGRVSGSWISGLEAYDVILRYRGRVLAHIQRLRAEYDPLDLIGADRRLESLVVDGGRVSAAQRGGEWDIAGALRSSADTSSGGGSFTIGRLRIEDLAATASLAPDSAYRIRDLKLAVSDLVLADTLLLTLDTLRTSVSPPTESSLWFEVAASGAATGDVVRLDPVQIKSRRSDVEGHVVLPLSFDDPRQARRLDVRLRALPLALSDLSAVFPAVAPGGLLRAEAVASGDGQLITAQLAGRLGEGVIRLEGGTAVGPGSPAVVLLDGEFESLNPSQFLRGAPAGRMSGEVSADLRGETLALADGSASLSLHGTTVGRAELPQVDLAAEVKAGRAEVDLSGRAAGGRFRAEGWVRPFDSVPEYRLQGRVVGMDGTEVVAQTLAADSGAGELALSFTLAGEGVSPATADLGGRVTLAALGGDKDGRIPLGDARITLEDGRLEVRPELLVAGGTVTGIVIARLDDTITYQVRRGRIDSVDLGRLLGDTVLAPLSARFSLDGKGVDPSETVLTARLEVDDLRYARRRLEELVARARLEDGRATMRLRGTLQEGQLAVDATGRPFDSVATFTVQRASLDSVDLGTFLDRPDLAGPVSLQATARGRLGPEVRSATGHLTLQPSRLGTLRVTGGEASAELAGERVTYEATLGTNGGDLALEGEARLADTVPSFAVRSGRVDSLDLGVLLGRDSLRTSIAARFEGAVRGTELDSMLARLRIELLPSRINQAQLGPGRVSLDVERGRVRGAVKLEGEDAALDATLAGHVGPDSTSVRAEGDLRVERLARWGITDSAGGRLEGRFDLTALADSTGLQTVFGTATAAGGVGNVRLQTLHLALGREPGTLQVDTLVLRSNVASLDGSGSLALGEGDVSSGDTLWVAGRAVNVQPLASLVDIDTLLLDSALIRVRVTGPPAERKVNGRLDLFRLLFGGTLAEKAAVRAVATVDSTGLGGLAGDLRANAVATGQTTFRDIAIAARYDSVAAVEAAVTVDHALRMAMNLRGQVEGDTIMAVLRRLQVVEDDRHWNLRSPVELAVRPGQVSVEDLVLATPSQAIAIDGVVSTTGTSDLTVRIDQLVLDALARAHLVPVGGTVNGTLHLSGPAKAPTVQGRLGMAVRHEGEFVGRLESDVEWTNTGLRLQAAAIPPRGERLTVEGRLPWTLTLAPGDTAASVGVSRAEDDAMTLVVRADSFDLGFFQPFLPEQAFKDLSGALAVNARIEGTPEEPEATGPLTVRGLEVTLPTIGVTYSESRLAARFEGERLAVDTLVLRTGDGRLLADGRVILEPLSNPSLEIAARLEEFQVSDSETLVAQATGDLQLGGTLEEPTLTGRLTLGPSEIILAGEGGGEAAVEPVELTREDLLEVAQRFGPGAASRGDEGPGLVDRFRLDIGVRFPDQVWFRKRTSPSVDIELAGRINIRQQPGEEMRFFGTVQPLPGRGEMDLYGRTFEIVEGDIVLQGLPEATKLDVTAQYQVPTQGHPDDEEVLVFVEATGQLDSLELEFSAEPSMSNEDIIAYIVTGRPASDNPLLAANAEGGVEASQVAINQVVGTLGGAVGEELGFDVFQIRQEAGRGLVLTAGRYLLPRLFVSLQQPLRTGPSAEQQVTGATGPGFELEYALRTWLRGTLRGGSLPTSVMLRGRYGF